MSKGIKLSPKHGVNPGMSICMYCGKETGVVLFGRIGDGRKHEDFEAPRKSVTSLDPCDDCKEKYKNDTLVVSIDDETRTPTGHWVAVSKEAIANETVKNSPVALMLSSEFDEMFKGEPANAKD